MNSIVKKLAENIKKLPNKTQVSIGVLKNGKEHYYELIQRQGSIIDVEYNNSVFEIGSITKCFTARILAQLVFEGKISLDSPIDRYLPFQIKGGADITFRHLVAHTSGLPRLPHNFSTYSNYQEGNPYANYTENQLATYLSNEVRLANRPGAIWDYSNLGYGVLGHVLSIITQRTFSNLVEERIFSMLGMNYSSYFKDAIKANLIDGLDKQGNVIPNWDGGVLSGCVGIYSTAKDLLKFSTDNLNSQNILNNMQFKELADIRAGVKMCMGWATSSSENGTEAYWHGGGTAGYGAILMLNRKSRNAVAILSNIEPHTFKDLVEPFAAELFNS